MSSVVWLQGDDAYRRAEFAQHHSLKLGVETVDRLPDGASNSLLAQSILGVSLLGDSKLVVAKDPQFLTSPSAPESIRFVETVVAHVPSGHYLLLISSKSVDGRTKAVQALKKCAQVHEFTAFKEWEFGKVREWVLSKVQSRKLSISPSAVDLVIDTIGFDTGLLDQTLETLAVYCLDVGKIEIASVVAVLGARCGSIFRLTEAMRVRKHLEVVKELVALEDEGEDPVKMIGIIGATLHSYLVTLEMLSTGHSFQEIGGVLERHPFSIQKGAPELKKHYTISQLTGMITQLHDLDYLFKSGQLSAKGMMPLMAGVLR